MLQRASGWLHAIAPHGAGERGLVLTRTGIPGALAAATADDTVSGPLLVVIVVALLVVGVVGGFVLRRIRMR